MNYTLHQLRVYRKVCECQSITRAAEALHLTQPAVSVQLKKFQEQFDEPLTEVLGRQLYITKFGHVINELAAELLKKADAIDSALDHHRGILTGHLRIASASTGKYVIPYFLTGFLRQNPKVSVSVNVTNKTRVVESLQKNELDFAMVSVVPEHLSLERYPLLSNELYLAAAADYPDLPSPMTPEALADYPLIFREEGSATRRAMEGYLQDRGIDARRSMQLVSNEAVKQAVRAGLGLSILARIGIRSELKLGAMQLIPLPGLPIVTEWNLVHARGKNLTRAARALVEYITTHRDEIVNRSFPEAR